MPAKLAHSSIHISLLSHSSHLPSLLPHTTTLHFVCKLRLSHSTIFTAFASPTCTNNSHPVFFKTNKSQSQAASCKQPGLNHCKWHSRPRQTLVSRPSTITYPLSSSSLPSAGLVSPPLPILYHSNCSLPAATAFTPQSPGVPAVPALSVCHSHGHSFALLYNCPSLLPLPSIPLPCTPLLKNINPSFIHPHIVCLTPPLACIASSTYRPRFYQWTLLTCPRSSRQPGLNTQPTTGPNRSQSSSKVRIDVI